MDQHPVLRPIALLGKRTILRHGRPVQQVLIQWENLPLSDATWEFSQHIALEFPDFNLDDKVPVAAGDNDAGQQLPDDECQLSSQYGATINPLKHNIRTNRVSTRVTKFKDYVM